MVVNIRFRFQQREHVQSKMNFKNNTAFKICILLLICCRINVTSPTCVLPNCNVLLMIADDLGIGDLGCYGNKFIKTPNIDRLASEGLKLNRMYAGPSDSGSMSAILTGRHPRKTGLVAGQYGWTSFWSLAQSGGLSYGDFSIGKFLSTGNINSFFTGKWNLGFQSGTIPTDSGFSSFYGTLLSHSVACTNNPENKFTDIDLFWMKIKDFAPLLISFIMIIFISKFHNVITLRTFLLFLSLLILSVIGIRIYSWMTLFNPSSCILMEDNVIVEQPYNEDKLSLQLTRHAVNFFNYRAKHHQPFLYIMSFLQTKYPSLRSFPFQNKTTSSYVDSVTELDWSIGKILQAVEENNLSNNTLIIFLSDNGKALTGPIKGRQLFKNQFGENSMRIENKQISFRGEKGSNFEGGLRVPAILKLPGKIKPNSETNVVTSIMDVYPTIQEYYGFEKSMHSPALDGKSLFPLFQNPKLTPSSSLHGHLYHYCDLGPVGAVTVGDLKIHFVDSKENDCRGPLLDTPQIYNISSDPSELRPLPTKDHLTLLYHLKASLRRYEFTANINRIKRSQFDEIPNPLAFPCDNFLNCTKNIDEEDLFNTLFD